MATRNRKQFGNTRQRYVDESLGVALGSHLRHNPPRHMRRVRLTNTHLAIVRVHLRCQMARARV